MAQVTLSGCRFKACIYVSGPNRHSQDTRFYIMLACFCIISFLFCLHGFPYGGFHPVGRLWCNYVMLRCDPGPVRLLGVTYVWVAGGDDTWPLCLCWHLTTDILLFLVFICSWFILACRRARCTGPWHPTLCTIKTLSHQDRVAHVHCIVPLTSTLQPHRYLPCNRIDHLPHQLDK